MADLSDILDTPTLLHIFEYMEAAELCLEVGPVCKRWRAVMKKCDLWFRIYRSCRIKPVEWKHVPEDQTGAKCGPTWDVHTLSSSYDMYSLDRKILKYGSTFNPPEPLPVHLRVERCNHGKCMKPVLWDHPIKEPVLNYCCNTWHWRKHRFSIVKKIPSKDYHREFVKDALAVATARTHKAMMNVHPIKKSVGEKYHDLVRMSNKYLKRKRDMEVLQEKTERLRQTREDLFPECRPKRKRTDVGSTPKIPKKTKKETCVLLKHMKI